MHYNYSRIHQTLRVSPAMAVGISDKLWSIADIVAVVDAWEERQRRFALRGDAA